MEQREREGWTEREEGKGRVKEGRDEKGTIKHRWSVNSLSSLEN